MHVLENPQKPCCNPSKQNYLVECEGELLSVFVGKQVQVFRLSRSTMVWERVGSLGNHTLYLNSSSALSAVAKTRKTEEKIYFPRYYGLSDFLSYSLRTGMYHSSVNEGSLKDYECPSEKLIFCGWIVPKWN